MIVPENKTVYVKGKKYKSGQECPDELLKVIEKKSIKKSEIKKDDLKKDEF